VFVFYGLMSGLGFGIYEGIDYQTGENVRAVVDTGDVGSYYLANVLRLTSAPFFHAVWTAIAAFLIWFGFRFPKRRLGFFALAIAVPATLHGIYDAFMDVMPIATLVASVVSVAILSVYVASADRLELDIAPVAELDGDAKSVAASAVPAP
jgi:RsiW-degrading membrane proteinase PrsW (M82 family)